AGGGPALHNPPRAVTVWSAVLLSCYIFGWYIPQSGRSVVTGPTASGRGADMHSHKLKLKLKTALLIGAGTALATAVAPASASASPAPPSPSTSAQPSSIVI